MNGYEFDVALSFAGEDRSYVEQVAHALREQGVAVFYDQFEVVELWGANLYERLDEIYRKGSRYAVVFTSEHYARKQWTLHEKRSIQARDFDELGEYLLPVRLDDADVDWVSRITGHLDGRTHSGQQVADHIVAKLGHCEPATGERPPFLTVPLTAHEKLRVVSERPAGWEFLLLAGVVWEHTEALRSKRLDQEMGYADRSGAHVPDEAIISRLRTAMDELATATAKVETLFGADRLAWATGSPGEPGDPVRIEHLGRRFGSSYAEILDWAAQLRGTAAGPASRRALHKLARLADEPVRTMQRFVDDLVTAGSHIASHYAGPVHADLSVTLGLTLTVDSAAVDELQAELDRLTHG
jgi:hypothetical protein